MAKANANKTKKRTKNTVATTKKDNGATRDVGVVREVVQGPMYTVMSNAQLNETFHKRYIKELQKLYSQIDHDAFVFTFIKMLKTVLEADDNNEIGHTALSFCAKFVTSFEAEKTHLMLAATFRWLLSTISNSPHIRYRICFFVNLILKELGPYAALDDTQCDIILNYMLDRLHDKAPSVRKQAVLAMQRLQMPDNPDDIVLCAYKFHLCSDPSPHVRQCVISCMGRNYLTVPHILGRLWDIDDKMRRHTFLNMCNYPVRSYKVSQRLTLLEQGLNDSSETVRKAVIKYMLKQWIEAYQRNLISLTAALKLDSTEEELLRFKRVARQMLEVIFERNNNTELLAQLPLSEDCELHRCVPHEELNLELVIYWQCLSGYLQQTQAEEFEKVLPELSVFCAYVEKFCQFQKPDMDKFAQIEFQCMLLSLVEILQTYDLGDEIGRSNLKQLITLLLKDLQLDHKIVVVLVRCIEDLVPDMNMRMQYFLEIIYDICELNTKQNDLVHDRNLVNKLLDDLDTSVKMKVSSLKVKILDLEEQEENYVRQKEYIKAKAVNDEKNAVTEQYTDLIRPLLEKHGVQELPVRPKLSKKERVLKGLFIAFYMVTSDRVKSLIPSLCKLYKDFICRQMASTETEIFEWAIKCGTSFSMFYESYTKEVFELLMEQFYKDNLRLCTVSAHCVFEIMDHYGIDYFIDVNQTEQAPKTNRRQLYTVQDFLDNEEETMQSPNSEGNTDIIGMMAHFMERVVDRNFGVALAKGLCRLVLRGQLNDRTDVLIKLLKRYFNPTTDTMINQVLSMFFEKMLDLKMQHILQPCLLPSLWIIMNCNFDSPLNEIMPETVTKFFIDMTQQDASTAENNIHNKIALSFLHYIHNYYTERKEMCRLLAKELTRLQLNVTNNAPIKEEMKELSDKLMKSELEPRMIRCLVNFKGMLDGNFNAPLRRIDGNESDEECDSATVTTTSEYMQAAAAEGVETVIAATAVNISKSNTEQMVEELSEGPSLVNPSAESAPPVAPQESSLAIANTGRASTAKSTDNAPPVLTTFGQDNQVGMRFLRRSLHKSISCSDAESICDAPPNERKSKSPHRHGQVKPIMKLNLRAAKSQQRLEAATTPDKESSRIAQADSDGSNTEDDDDDESAVNENEPNLSDVIAASPTSASPNVTEVSRLRLRTIRNRNTRKEPAPATKRKVLHLEMHTPLRNGRKRVLRKSPSLNKSSSLSSDGAMATPSNSSSRHKQHRMEPPAKQQRQQTPKRQINIAKQSSKATASPTESTSSVKENEAPKQVTKTPQPLRTPVRSQRKPADAVNSLSAVITRNSARTQRISSMCMTRKRMSLEMNLSGGQLKAPTPKRVQRERKTRTSTNSNATKASDANSSTSDSAAGRTRSSASKLTLRPRRK